MHTYVYGTASPLWVYRFGERTLSHKQHPLATRMLTLNPEPHSDPGSTNVDSALAQCAQGLYEILMPLTALTRLSLAAASPSDMSSAYFGGRLPNSLCQLSRLAVLELRGHSEQTFPLELPEKLESLGQLTLLRFTDVLTCLGRSAIARLTALVELSIIAPAGCQLGCGPAPPAALPCDISALQRLRVLQLSCHRRPLPPLVLPQLTLLWLGQPLLQHNDRWQWLAELPALADLSIVEPDTQLIRASASPLLELSMGSGLTSLQAIGAGATGLSLPFGPYLHTLRRLDITLVPATPAGDPTQQLCHLWAATQLSELRLRGAWPGASVIGDLSRMRPLPSLLIEHARNASPAEVANEVLTLQRRLPNMEVTCLEPGISCCCGADDNEDDNDEDDDDEDDYDDDDHMYDSG